MKEWLLRQSVRMQFFLAGDARGSLEDITGKAWIFVVVIVGIVMFFGPMVVNLVKGNVGSSINTVSSNFSFNNLVS